MSLPFWDPRKALEFPPVYNFFQKAVRADKPRRQFIKDFVAPLGRARVLEVGCGPGTNCAWLPDEIEYVGCDLSEEYIAYAKKHFGGRADFHATPVGQLGTLGLTPFNAVIAIAVLHHLNDEEVVTLSEEVLRLLVSGGVFFTVDPCYFHGQPRFRRFVTSCDRGGFVRYPEQYQKLLGKRFPQVSANAEQRGLLDSGVVMIAVKA